MGASSCWSSNPQLQDAMVIDADGPWFAILIKSETAPKPLLRLGNQSALDRISMHVAQLFDALAFRPDVEIIESPLPNVYVFTLWFPKVISARAVAAAAFSSGPSVRIAV
jgi:hypothetical protein